MVKHNLVRFPFDFKEMAPEERAEIMRLFKYPKIDLIRVGPKGYVMHRPYKDLAENIYNLHIRPTDVFVASYQRSGTTWTQELVWLIANDFDFETALTVPISCRYPFLELYMYYTEFRNDCLRNKVKLESIEKKEKLINMLDDMAELVTEKLAAMPSPRFIKTHLPLTFLPPRTVDTAKHVKEAWNMRHHPKMLFLFYEELSKDLPAVVRRVADFLGKSVSEKQVTRLCDHLSFENFKKNKAVNYEDLREFDVVMPNETFIRKGKANGWRDYFDEEMTKQAERWIEDNLRNTDLRFPQF